MSDPAIPIQPQTPGAGPSFDPEIVDRLAANDHLFLEEFKRYHDIVNFLQSVQNWKTNSQQRVALGLPLDPRPQPPEGYTPAPDVPPAPPTPPSSAPRVGQRITGHGRPDYYPAPGDINPAGTRIANPNGTGYLVKVVDQTPFGEAHYWEDAR